jgi:hypothetical protein
VLKQGLGKIKSCLSCSVPRRRAATPRRDARAPQRPRPCAARGRTPPEPRSFPTPSHAPRRSESASRHASAHHPRRTGRTRGARPSGPSTTFPPSCVVLRREPSRHRHCRSGRTYLRPSALPPRTRPRSRRSTVPAMAAA